MVRLLLVDDHPVVLGGLVAALAPRAEVEVVRQATTLAEAKVALASTPVDVALVDVRLPDGSGFELLQWATSMQRPPAFLMLTTFTTPQYVATAIQLGAKGYLLKTSPTDEIIDAISRLSRGGLAFMTDGNGDGPEVSPPSFTPRDREIITGLLQGQTNKGLSADLGISQKTVEWHLGRLFQRLGVQSRTELVATVQREGWLDFPQADRHGGR